MLSIVNKTRGQVIARKVRIASSWKERLVGLLATRELGVDDGLWITPCKSIHTYFMRYPIDVLFLNRENRVVYQKTLQPWRLSAWKASSQGVLEVAGGTLLRTGTECGDELEIQT